MRHREVEGCMEVAIADTQTQVEQLPSSVYLLQEIHSSICGHCKATDPIHGREMDFPVVSRRKSCLLVHGGVTVYGTHPTVRPDG